MKVVWVAMCLFLAVGPGAHAWKPFRENMFWQGHGQGLGAPVTDVQGEYTAEAALDRVQVLPGWGKPAHGLFSGCA